MAGARIEFAHLLRGVAAGTVVLSHLTYLIWRQPEAIGQLIAYPPVRRIVQGAEFAPITDFGLPYFWGYFGVALFFLISGFVIPFSVSSSSRSGFVTARLFRIWPTYLVGLTVAVACIASNSMLAKNPFPLSSMEILTNALIVPRWPTLTRSIDGIIWTLEVEIFFYAVCALLMDHIRRFDRRIFLWAAVVVPLAFVAGWKGGLLIHVGMPIYALANWISTVPVYICFMLCGVAFYYHYQGRFSHIGLLIAQGLLLAVFVTGMHIGVLALQGWSTPICFLIAYGVFTLGYVARERVAALPHWASRPFYWLADISYPLYVIHAVLGYTILAHAIEAGAPAWVAVAVALTAVLTLAVLVHLSVELPSRWYGKALAGKMFPAWDLNAQCDSAAMSPLNIATTSDTGPNFIIRPSRR
jgi:peptidoglycan/LPS O-acetylase OafA/YrhL